MFPARPDNPVLLVRYRRLPHRLVAICEDCVHVGRLDLEALIARYGDGFDTEQLRRRLRCTRCGSRNASVQINGSPCGAMARHDPDRRR